MSSAKVKVAVVGAGYWGVHHVRVFNAEPGAELVAVCDASEAARTRAGRIAPDARLTGSFDEILADREIDAVVLATPARAPGEQGLRALRAGKHVLVEKPMALAIADAEAMAAEARTGGRVLAVGHLMLYHPAVVRLREMLASRELGQLYYLLATRVNLGKLRRDENALWSFAPHDLAMADYLLDGEMPVSIAARGQSYLQAGVEDVVFVTLKYADGRMAHIHLSWLDPRKERRFTLVCSKKMVEFDDVAAEKLKIYDKGYDKPPEFAQYAEYLTLRQGDIHIPHIPMSEPLSLEGKHFVDCVRTGATPRADGASGVRCVRILEAAQASLDRDGVPTILGR
jgi:predicted dehydrogenase